MTKSLSGKTVLVTGASRGLGVHLVRALAEAGADLILCARDAERLSTVAQEFIKAGSKVSIIVADITRSEERRRLVEEAGSIDVLVNNAGLEIAMRLLDQTDEDVSRQLELNLATPIDLTRRVLPGMIERKSGVIVNISSMSGKSPTPFNSVYAATKFGLNGFTSSIAIELEGTGVHVGVVCPSFIAESGMWADTGLKAPAMLKEVSPTKVAKAVLKVIAGAREVLVTPSPVRPLLAIKEILPGLDGGVLRAMGVLKVLEERADTIARSRG
jgi:short-subunit dehydrogenase